MQPKIYFAGSSDFSCPIFKALLASGFKLAGVLTTLPKEEGRGQYLQAKPVEDLARKEKLSVFYDFSSLRAEKPDLLIVASYGKIIPKDFIDFPTHGILNVHPSMLPRWRGATPVPATILAGDALGGVTVQKTVFEMDAGPVIAQREYRLNGRETTGQLLKILADEGAELLLEVLSDYLGGKIDLTAQDESKATNCHLLKKSDGLLQPEQEDAEIAERKVRAYNPWPSAYLSWGDSSLKIWQATICDQDLKPGQWGVQKEELYLGFKKGSLRISEIQPAGKKKMTAGEFVRGYRERLVTKKS